MEFTIGNISRCAGQTHIRIPVSITNGPGGTIDVTLDELQGDPPNTIQQAKELALARIRSAAKEAGANNWAQLQTALNGKVFKI